MEIMLVISFGGLNKLQYKTEGWGNDLKKKKKGDISVKRKKNGRPGKCKSKPQ